MGKNLREEEEEEDRNFQRIFFNYLRSEMREKFNCEARSPRGEREEEIKKKERGGERKKKNFEIN